MRRSPIYAPNGVVVSTSAWVAQAAIDVLQNGATSCDACVAAMGVSLALDRNSAWDSLTATVCTPGYDQVDHLRITDADPRELLPHIHGMLDRFGVRSLCDLLRPGVGYAAETGDREAVALLGGTESMVGEQPQGWEPHSFTVDGRMRYWADSRELRQALCDLLIGTQAVPSAAAPVPKPKSQSRIGLFETIAVDHRGMMCLLGLSASGHSMGLSHAIVAFEEERILALAGVSHDPGAISGVVANRVHNRMGLQEAVEAPLMDLECEPRPRGDARVGDKDGKGQGVLAVEIDLLNGILIGAADPWGECHVAGY